MSFLMKYIFVGRGEGGEIQTSLLIGIHVCIEPGEGGGGTRIFSHPF